MNRYLMLFILYLLMSVGFVFADNIVTKDGTLLNGIITSASKDSVNIQIDIGLKTIAKSDVLSFVFTNADYLFILGDTKIICKIVNKIDDDVILVTRDSVRKISNGTIDKVQRNIGAELTVSEIPETGPQFINHPSQSVWTGERKSNIFLRIQLAVHFASLNRWESQFIVTSGNGSPTNGLVYGGEIGYAFSEIVQIGIGYEGFDSRKVQITNTSPTFDTRASYTYLYGTLRAGDFLTSTPALYLYGACDIGSLKGSVLENYSNGIKLEGTGTAVAFRVKGGGEYYFNGNWSVTSELGYLIGKVNKISIIGKTVPNYDLDYSGLSIILAFSYHIPLH